MTCELFRSMRPQSAARRSAWYRLSGVLRSKAARC